MAHDDPTRAGHSDGFLSLKTVLGGLGTCLLLLGGITWELVNSQHTDEMERRQATDSKQWERLRELNTELETVKYARGETRILLDQLRKDLDETKQRVRDLEQRLNGRH